MNEAEAHDLNLLLATERLLRTRRMPTTGLFQPDLIVVLDPGNDNPALAARPSAQKSGSE